VMDGAAPSVAGQNWPWAGPAPAGTVLTVRAVGLAEAKVPFMSPLVRKSEFLGVDFGERDGQVSLRARLDVQTAETAGQVRKVVEGLLAMGLLEVGDNAAAVGVLRRVQIAGEGRTVSVDWQVPAPELLGLLASLHAPPAQP